MVFHANGNHKESGIAILLDKIDYNTKTIMRQRMTLHNDQRFILRRRYNNWKYIYMHPAWEHLDT